MIEQARARVDHDLYYIEHWSVSKALMLTLPVLLSCRNAY
jgi:hypothetical protein